MATRALWYTGKGIVDLRNADVAKPAAGQVAIRALYSAISRGTERLVSEGRVPKSEYERMRCPNQQGDFPFPVKYGYALVGTIEAGPTESIGQNVFALYPHQERAVLAADAVVPVPDGLPPRRAALAANMETALTAIWDAQVSPGDKVLVVGGGTVGLLIAGLAARIAGTTVTVTDVAASRAEVAVLLGARFALPAEAPGEQDVAFSASATDVGLKLALERAGREARVVEASWHGDRTAALPLGEAFHARRLQLISSQVGSIPADHAARWTNRRRLATALELLRDPAYDALIEEEIPFDEAPRRLPAVLAKPGSGLMTLLRYD